MAEAFDNVCLWPPFLLVDLDSHQYPFFGSTCLRGGLTCALVFVTYPERWSGCGIFPDHSKGLLLFRWWVLLGDWGKMSLEGGGLVVL